MSRLYHPQWVRTNGEIGGGVFQDWTIELMQYGSDGVLRGIQAIRDGGNVYMPGLNKFMAECRVGSHSSSGGDSDAFGRTPKPTPDGMPMCFLTEGGYTAETMLNSPHKEDREVGAEMQRLNMTEYQQYRKHKCEQMGIDYQEQW